MGNGVGKLPGCFVGVGPTTDRRRKVFVISNPIDDLGHSCYIRPKFTGPISSSKVHSESDGPQTTTFKSISDAAISANTSTPLSTDLYSYNSVDWASAFEGSTSFASFPLQPIPRSASVNSGSFYASGPIPNSVPMERGFMSGLLDRGIFSGPLKKGCSDRFKRSYSHGGLA